MGVMREEEVEEGRWVWIPSHGQHGNVTFEQAQNERIIRLLEQLVVQTRKPSPHQAIK